MILKMIFRSICRKPRPDRQRVRCRLRARMSAPMCPERASGDARNDPQSGQFPNARWRRAVRNQHFSTA
jgi:hypothetical protein